MTKTFSTLIESTGAKWSKLDQSGETNLRLSIVYNAKNRPPLKMISPRKPVNGLSPWRHPVNPIVLATHIFSHNRLQNVYNYGFQSYLFRSRISYWSVMFIWVWVDWMTSLPASTQSLSLPGSINGGRAKLRNNAKITGLLVKFDKQFHLGQEKWIFRHSGTLNKRTLNRL